jgi:hypothetical protein
VQASQRPFVDVAGQHDITRSLETAEFPIHPVSPTSGPDDHERIAVAYRFREPPVGRYEVRPVLARFAGPHD